MKRDFGSYGACSTVSLFITLIFFFFLAVAVPIIRLLIIELREKLNTNDAIGEKLIKPNKPIFSFLPLTFHLIEFYLNRLPNLAMLLYFW